MEIERFDPDGLAARPFYHHVVRSTATTTVHISGQVGLDSDGNVVGGEDFAAHIRQAYSNLDTALAAASVTRDQVVKVTTFVVDYDHETKWPHVKEVHSAFFSEVMPAWTVIGVEALARPDLLIEVEATAVSD